MRLAAQIGRAHAFLARQVDTYIHVHAGAHADWRIGRLADHSTLHACSRRRPRFSQATNAAQNGWHSSRHPFCKANNRNRGFMPFLPRVLRSHFLMRCKANTNSTGVSKTRTLNRQAQRLGAPASVCNTSSRFGVCLKFVDRAVILLALCTCFTYRN